MTPEELEQELRANWLTSEQAARLIGISGPALREKFKRRGRKELTHIRPFGTRLYSRAAVEKYAKKCREKEARRRAAFGEFRREHYGDRTPPAVEPSAPTTEERNSQ